jgi:hypothetical protein
MNELLEFAGALLYFVLNIVLFPLFLLVDAMLWSVIALRRGNLYMARLKPLLRNQRISYRLKHLMDGVLERGLR